MPQLSKDSFGNVWFDTIGAAHILCPLEHLGDWQGVDDARYDLACSENTATWMRSLPDAKGKPSPLFSFWMEPSSASWQPGGTEPEPRLGLLWRWVQGKKSFALTGAELPEYARLIEPSLVVPFPKTDYLLFDSVDTGTDGLETGLKLNLPAPLRTVRTYQFKPDEITLFIIHEFMH